MTPDAAQIIALQALGWLAGHDELLPVFLGSTGCSAADLAAAADSAEMQASILDFVTMDDAWVRQFCEAHALPYDAPLRARQALPGAEQVHWT